MKAGRLITWGKHRPSFNMAADQAILRSVEQGGPPTLRFYGWSEPALSLGYFQPLSDRSGHLPSESVTCVRRATGGGAILHHHELTYSIAVPTADKRFGAREDMYERTHLAIATGLGRLGIRATPFRLTGRGQLNGGVEPFLCFQRRTSEDLVVAGYKILGSAQRRGRGALLQHGSLLVRSSTFAPELPGLCELCSREVEMEGLIEAMLPPMSELFDCDRWKETSTLTVEETGWVDDLERDRFANSKWLHRR